MDKYMKYMIETHGLGMVITTTLSYIFSISIVIALIIGLIKKEKKSKAEKKKNFSGVLIINLTFFSTSRQFQTLYVYLI